MNANFRFKPVPWVSVLLAAFPGLLVALTRRHAVLLGPVLPVLGYLYLALLLLGLPLLWWRNRRFPVWALLPAGAVIWHLTYLAGGELSQGLTSLPFTGWIGIETGIALLNVLLAAVVLVAMLRGRQIPAIFWLALGVMLFGNLLLAIGYSLSEAGSDGLVLGIIQYFTVFGISPLEGLMLVAVGLLAARQQGILAILFVIGGYSYMCMDSDYFSAFLLEGWTGLPLYLMLATALYLVVTPVVFLRARTRLWRALALFAPVVAFLVTLKVVPALVTQQPFELSWGEIIFSINILLSFVLAWILYSHFGDSARQELPDEHYQAAPVPN